MAVSEVELTNEVVNDAPSMLAVQPLEKFVPVSVMFTAVFGYACNGAMVVIVGPGGSATTVNVVLLDVCV